MRPGDPIVDRPRQAERSRHRRERALGAPKEQGTLRDEQLDPAIFGVVEETAGKA